MHGLSIVIPVYNNWNLTKACLNSLHLSLSGTDCEIIVVDNASTDDTTEHLESIGRSLFGERFSFIINPQNRNFALACNQGAVAARYEYIFFLNNDTLPQPGWCEPLLARLESEPKLGGIGPVLVFADDTIQHIGATILADRGIGHIYTGIDCKHHLAQKRRRLRYITAAALLMRKEQFLNMGGFFPDFVNGLEDVDLCWRMGREGYYFSVEPGAFIYHLESQSRGMNTGAGGGNVPLLDSRCFDLRRPEYHLIAEADGYEACFGLFFETFLRPKKERLSHYIPLLQRPDPGVLEKILNREIYWQEGWHKLAEVCEYNKGAEAALEVLIKAMRFFPSFETIIRVKECALRAKREDVAEEYATLQMRAGNLAQDRAFLQKKFVRILQTARDLKDNKLMKMLGLWQRIYGQTLGVSE